MLVVGERERRDGRPGIFARTDVIESAPVMATCLWSLTRLTLLETYTVPYLTYPNMEAIKVKYRVAAGRGNPDPLTRGQLTLFYSRSGFMYFEFLNDRSVPTPRMSSPCHGLTQ